LGLMAGPYVFADSPSRSISPPSRCILPPVSTMMWCLSSFDSQTTIAFLPSVPDVAFPALVAWLAREGDAREPSDRTGLILDVLGESIPVLLQWETGQPRRQWRSVYDDCLGNVVRHPYWDW